MLIEWDVPIQMDDGVSLRADIFRPPGSGRYPVILSHGPYGKGLSFQEGRTLQWEALVSRHPDVLEGSSNRYQVWEVPDPERFVPYGYVCIRVDSRGAGRSPGLLDPLSPREVRDLRDCIEWAGMAAWSNGRVGLLGISYYAINQWQVATTAPPHLCAICPWEGGFDHYRDLVRHGGILSSFWSSWYHRRVLPVQHGVGTHGPTNAITGDTVAGPETLSPEELKANRVDFPEQFRSHRFDDDFFRSRTPQPENITVPLLSAANWGGLGLHSRGNFEGFVHAHSHEKWLEVHGGSHWEQFYTAYGTTLQRRFFDRFLKEDDNDWHDEWPVQIQVRSVTGFHIRRHTSWPPSSTHWTELFLDFADRSLVHKVRERHSQISYSALGTGITICTDPFSAAREICGPSSLRLFLSTTATDADLFVVLRLLDPDGHETRFQGAQDPAVPLSQGWLRLSMRGIDEDRTQIGRPYHHHRSAQPVQPGAIYEVQVEIWPTSIIVPPQYRLALSVRGRDDQIDDSPNSSGIAVTPMNGSGRCIHDDATDRVLHVLEGTTTLFSGPEHPSSLTLPFQRI